MVTIKSEKEIKELYKWALENRKKQLSKEQKELLKQAIDQSKTVEELLFTAIMSNMIN